MTAAAEALFAAAAPPCPDCHEPIRRVEHSWRFVAGEWRLRCFWVCDSGHRTVVRPLG
jgi:hypothetical protein